MNRRPYTAVLIVPTGIGASVGGYAGDALPVARAMATMCDRLITHPNVLNGAQLYWSQPNLFYTEGYALDKFANSCWKLRPVHQNRVGLLLDRAIEPELRLRHVQAAEATRATLGLELTDYWVTDAPLKVELQLSDTGASWGTVGNLDSLLRGAETLIRQTGATAIAVVARFPDESGAALDDYRHGQGVDPIAGAEAIISHAIVREFQVPCAHAPALSPLPVDPNLSPRAAAEELGYTFLPCVLVGLSRAPQIVTDAGVPSDLRAEDVDAVVVPATACGSSAVLGFSQLDARIIAVTENRTRMQVAPEQLAIQALQVNSYLEALGVIAADRAGISPAALIPTLASMRCLSNPHSD